METDIDELLAEYKRDIKSGYVGNTGAIIERVGEPILDIVSQLLESDNEKIRYHAIKNISLLGPVSLNLLKTASNDSSLRVREQAIEELGRIGEPALSILSQLYNDEAPEIRYAVIVSLPEINESLELLTKAIDDPHPKIGMEGVEKVVTKIGFSAIRSVIFATEAVNGKVSQTALYYLVPDNINFQKHWLESDSIYFPTEILNQILTIIMDDLVIRKSGRPADLFNSKIIKFILEELIPQNPSLRTRIFTELCEIAYEYDGGPRQRAVAVARQLSPEEFAAQVRGRSSQNPQTATQIMRELGGSEATAFFTESQSQTLAEYRAPLIDLEDMARQRWEELTLEAKSSSAASKWMSIGVFIVGTVIVFWAFILLTLSKEPWQQFAAALAGIGSFLVMYSQRFWKEPVEQIQRFSSQQARLEIAFIGYMNRVAQIRLLFEDAYTKDKLSPEMVANYQQWLQEATDKAWQQLGDAPTVGVSNSGNDM